jgi:hypothetical protein
MSNDPQGATQGPFVGTRAQRLTALAILLVTAAIFSQIGDSREARAFGFPCEPPSNGGAGPCYIEMFSSKTAAFSQGFFFFSANWTYESYTYFYAWVPQATRQSFIQSATESTLSPLGQVGLGRLPCLRTFRATDWTSTPAPISLARCLASARAAILSLATSTTTTTRGGVLGLRTRTTTAG